MKKTDDGDWRREIERERLRMEKVEAEFRKNEAVARLAIELGRNGPGRGGRNFTPDVDAAARLLTDAAAARRREQDRPERELKELAESLWNEHERRYSNPLLWHEAKWGAKDPGAGGKVSCGVLCQPGTEADKRIHVGRFEFEELPDGAERTKWVKLGTWQIWRDAERFRELVRLALQLICDQVNEERKILADTQFPEGSIEADYSEQIRDNPTLKCLSVKESDVSRVLENGEIPEKIFNALVEAQKDRKKLMGKCSAGSEARPPRGKRAKSQ